MLCLERSWDANEMVLEALIIKENPVKFHASKQWFSYMAPGCQGWKI